MGYLLLEGGAEFGGRMRDPDLKAIELAGGFDAFNLSDIFEYLDADAARDAFAGLLAVANRGARLH